MGVIEELEREAAEAQRARKNAEDQMEQLRDRVRTARDTESRITKTIKIYKGEPLSAPKAPVKSEPGYKRYRPTDEVLSDVREAAIRLSASQPDGKFSMKELIDETPRSDPAVRNAAGVLREEEKFLRKAGTRNGNGKAAVDLMAVYPEKMPRTADPEQV